MSALEAVVSFAHKLGMLIYLALKPAMVVTYSGSSVVFLVMGTVLCYMVFVLLCTSGTVFVTCTVCSVLGYTDVFSVSVRYGTLRMLVVRRRDV